MKISQQLPRQLGIQSNFKGYFYLADALDLLLEDETALVLFTKTLFPVIARKRHTSISSVERNIRTAIEHCWKSPCREKLQEIAPYHLVKQPTVGEFLDILYWHMKSLEE